MVIIDMASNKDTYTFEEFPFAHYKRHWKKHYAKKFYKNTPLREFVSKVKNKELAQELGIRVPKTYYIGNYDKCPKEILERKDIIIKKISGGGGNYGIDIQHEWENHEVIIEEYIRHFRQPDLYKIPFDYKTYVFRGKVLYVLISNRNYGGNTKNPARMLLKRNKERCNNRLKLPNHRLMKDIDFVIPSQKIWNELITASEHIGKTVFKDVFVRIDFYLNDEGVVFGELSPNPCGTYTANFHRIDDRLNEQTLKMVNAKNKK